MAYTKTTWVNNNSPYINATNLNHIEQGVYDVDNSIGDMSNLSTTATNLVGAINEINTPIAITTDGSAIKTGRTIDGNEEYCKRISLDSLPAQNVTKTWEAGINMANVIIVNYNVTAMSSSGNWFILPNNDIVNSKVQLNSDGKLSITMLTGNLSGQNGYAEIYYYYAS